MAKEKVVLGENRVMILNYDEMKKEGRGFPCFIEGVLIAYLSAETDRSLIDLNVLAETMNEVISDFLETPEALKLINDYSEAAEHYKDCLRKKIAIMLIDNFYITFPKSLGAENFKKILEEVLDTEVVVAG